MRFVNLHGHTTFSFGDGFGTPQQHVERAAELGYNAIAATEHGNVSSHFQLEKAAIKAGIKPIFGLEAYCGSVLEENDERRLAGKESAPYLRPARGQFKHHLTILAASAGGYRNLNRIVTQSYLDYYYHPTVSGTSLSANSDGLIVASGCSGSQLACALLGGKGTPEHNDRPDYAAAREVMGSFIRVLGDRYYLEVQPFYELERSCAMNKAYERLSKETGVRLVVTHDVHYPTMDDAEMQAVLHAVHRGKASVDDVMREWNYDVPCTLPESDRALADRLVRTGMSPAASREAIATSTDIAERCNVTLPKAERLSYSITEEDLKPWSLRLGTVVHVEPKVASTGSSCAKRPSMPAENSGGNSPWLKPRSQ
jgi:DNA polymerase-3 subunit alpha